MPNDAAVSDRPRSYLINVVATPLWGVLHASERRVPERRTAPWLQGMCLWDGFYSQARQQTSSRRARLLHKHHVAASRVEVELLAPGILLDDVALCVFTNDRHLLFVLIN